MVDGERTKLGGRLTVGMAFALTLVGCISLRPVIVAEKTPLENEILGEFERVHRELMLPTSASRPADEGLSPAQRRALQALLDRQANQSEIAPLKQKKVLVELRTGMLGIDRATAQQEGEDGPELEALVKRENQARLAFAESLIELSPKLSKSDMPKVKALLYRLNR